MHVRNFIGRDEPWTNGTEGVVGLALGPLSAALDLEVALRDVVADRVACDMLQRVGFGDVLGLGADNDCELHFPVQLGGFTRLFDSVVRSAQAGVGLEENDRLGRNRHAGFGGVVGVVQADGDEFGDVVDWCAEARIAVNQRQGGRIDRGDFGQTGGRQRFAVDILDQGRQVANAARTVEQSGLLLAHGAITNQFHSQFLFVLVRCFIRRMFHATGRGEIQPLVS